ncbi:MAG: serpin family protein [bacterium]|nr:serpin family protein [bacterium]
MKSARIATALLLAALPITAFGGGSIDIAPAVNSFGVDLHHALHAEDGNLFLSPASISYALGMTRTGARGRTAAEMDQVLHLTGSEGDAVAYSRLMDSLLEGNDAVTLRLANRLYGQTGLGFRAEFLATVDRHFRGGFEEVDYRADAERARGLINTWVSDQTAARIPELLVPGTVGHSTRLVLVNAIYFLGDWQIRFPAENTRPRPFHLADGTTADVPMMSETSIFGYAAPAGLQVLALPYKGGTLEMIVLLPTAKEGLDGLAGRLNSDTLAAWLAGPAPTRTRVVLPKFEFTSEFLLRETLVGLGMRAAFTGAADFSGMVSGGGLAVDDVVHKAYVRVDEKGTEAAAATGVIMKTTAMPPPPAAEFVADRPFLFLIRHIPTGTVLFQGRVSDPRS